MVASDTIVGLVGAGILIVALVGVFVYESGAGGKDFTATLANPAFTEQGTVKLQKAAGTSVPNPINNQPVCLEQAGCRLDETTVRCNFDGLPRVDTLFYVGYLFKSGDGTAKRLNELKANGTKYSLEYTMAEDSTAFNTLVVSLETSAQAAKPTPTAVLYSKPVREGPNDCGGGTPTNLGAGTHKLTLDDASGNTAATVTFDGLTNQTGLEYRAWLQRADGTYKHLANYTGFTGATLNGSVSGGASGKIGDFNLFVVTLEKPGAAVDKPHGFGPLFTAQIQA